MRAPSGGTGPALAWALVLVAAGVAGAVVSIVTSPGTGSGTPDPFDSPYQWLCFLALVPLTAAAGWFVPRAGRWWGIVATAPHVFAFAVLVARAAGDPGPSLAPVGLLVLLVLSLPPWGAGVAAASLRRRRERGGLAAR